MAWPGSVVATRDAGDHHRSPEIVGAQQLDPHRARETFAIPDDHAPVAMIAVGYAGDPDRLAEDYRKREEAPRARKPLEEIAFGGTWGEATPLIETG